MFGVGSRWNLARTLLLLASAAGFAGADDSAGPGSVRGRVSIPQKFQQELPPGQGLALTKVIVDGGKFTVLPTSDGYFAVNGVGPGPHYLQVVHPLLIFDPVRVEVSEGAGKNAAPKMTAYLADLEYGQGAKLKYPLGLAPSGMFQYLEKRDEFNVLTILKNPMALISLFSFGAMFLLPKLQPMLEEEKRQRAEQEEKERAIQGGAAGEGARGGEARGQ
uniref:ER membrane protein complex subunit 7 beta-sandwich domain-containing protein n=1 Tax=Zooxanthella nutricula TaxID=1333877 RepID=A0A6U6L9U2_9DINO|mmetsp:Transcript_30989/g.93710  ORF Transcript_30989/g.93710 Transcript_30989/m.93710 type:complete len:219 (+) Transcript_30989:106-762(+)